MSIENNIERIAFALEAIANQMAAANGATAQAVETPAPQPSAPAPQPAEPVVNAPAPQPVMQAAPAPAPQPAEQPVVHTAETINQLCVDTAQRLGSSDRVKALLGEYNVNGVRELKPEQYNMFVNALKAM
jgi:hypothetical protein